MMAFLSRVSRGLISMDEKVIYTEELGRGVQSGTFRYMSPGFTFTLRDALANMIITSDNVCTGVIFRTLGQSHEEQIQVVNDYCRAIGMRSTVHRHAWLDTKGIAWHHTEENMTMTSASDQAELLVKMVAGSRDADAARRISVTPELCSLALCLMGKENGLLGMSGLLPQDATMASKSGRDVRGRAHIGIAYRDDEPLFAMACYVDWVPTVLLDGMPGNAKALELIAELTRIAWDELSSDLTSDHHLLQRKV